MKHNVGKTDKIVRIILAIISVYFAYTYSSWIYILTAILIVTASTSFCGLYTLLGINTTKKKK